MRNVVRLAVLAAAVLVLGLAAQAGDEVSLDGKVMCGYQGWFNTPNDGAGREFGHWTERRDQPFEDGNVHVDLWPDMSELEPSELYPTKMHYADGRVVSVYSAAHRATVMRHFKWMREYGIDGLYMGVPVVLGSNGVERVVELALSDAEQAELDASAEAVREVVGVLQG